MTKSIHVRAAPEFDAPAVSRYPRAGKTAKWNLPIGARFHEAGNYWEPGQLSPRVRYFEVSRGGKLTPAGRSFGTAAGEERNSNCGRLGYFRGPIGALSPRYFANSRSWIIFGNGSELA